MMNPSSVGGTRAYNDLYEDAPPLALPPPPPPPPPSSSVAGPSTSYGNANHEPLGSRKRTADEAHLSLDEQEELARRRAKGEGICFFFWKTRKYFPSVEKTPQSVVENCLFYF